MPVTLAEVQQQAEQLTPAEQAQLIAHLARRLAATLPATPAQTGAGADPWTKLASFGREMETLAPPSPDPSEQLLADRRSRQQMIEGSDHVHP